MSLSLVVLAAGVGSRYGGPKQIDRVGPGGGTLVDYAVYDAQRAGFERAILVVAEGREAEMRDAVGDRIARRVPVAYAQQPRGLPEGYSSPQGRSKPWGTGPATLAAAPLVDGPFAVVNADDFYGAASYRVLVEHLRQPPTPGVPEHALVGFPLAATLSADGAVSRAICSVDASGYLTSIREVLEIERDGEDARELDTSGAWHRLARDTPVSLNFWGFTPGVLEPLARGYERFLAKHAASLTAEYYLPGAVQELVAEGRARVRVLGGGGTWAGLTHAGDRKHLVETLRELTARGLYPADLWA
jgi:hypothetical protein